MADIFISYSSEDKTIVKKIASLLEEKNWTVWWDRKIPLGQAYDSVIETELALAKCVVVIWTKKSVQSEWVKNEALEASSNKILVPIILEEVKIPLVFKRIEAAMMINWDGNKDHAELELFYQAIQNILDGKSQNEYPNEDHDDTKLKVNQYKRSTHSKWILIGTLIGVFALIGYFFMTNKNKNIDAENQNISIRVFDLFNNKISEGEVKLFLDEYSREQSIDKLGQALFIGIPRNKLEKKIRIELSSPGFKTEVIDTLLGSVYSFDLFLAQAEYLIISGRVKTAEEIPIKDVEVSLDGTKYAAISNTDGSYQLKFKEYSLGDEITITTSHEAYQDKTIPLKIASPEQANFDIFLSPSKKIK